MDQQMRRFGLYDVSILRDGFFETSSDVLTHTAGEAARGNALARWGKPTIGIEVNCFLLRGLDGITLVDAGTGASWGDAFGHARTALVAAGVQPEQVDRVLITHLHGDHALGLFDGEKPYFPKAGIVRSQDRPRLFHRRGEACGGAESPAGRLRHRGKPAAPLWRPDPHGPGKARFCRASRRSCCPAIPMAIAAT